MDDGFIARHKVDEHPADTLFAIVHNEYILHRQHGIIVKAVEHRI